MEEFHGLKRYVERFEIAKAHMKRYKNCAVIEGDVATKVQDPFKTKFRTLFKFSGALSNVFLVTATVESDFFIFKWEEDIHQSGLTDLSLERILHCK